MLHVPDSAPKNSSADHPHPIVMRSSLRKCTVIANNFFRAVTAYQGRLVLEGKLIQLGSRLDHGRNINFPAAGSWLGSHTKPTQQVLIFAEVINIAQEAVRSAKIRETRPLFGKHISAVTPRFFGFHLTSAPENRKGTKHRPAKTSDNRGS